MQLFLLLPPTSPRSSLQMPLSYTSLKLRLAASLLASRCRMFSRVASSKYVRAESMTTTALYLK